jgi:serine/threonine protein kinase
MTSIATIFSILAAVFIGAIVLAAVIFLFIKLFGMTFVVLRNIFRFIGEEITDTLRFVGAVLASVLFAPLVVLSIVIGRWSASKHYAGAFMAELRSAGRCVYRLFIGNLARLFGLSKALEGVEQRVPEVMAAAPTRDKPSKRTGIFEGYTIVGSLKGGGSGGKLYIAEPDEIKQAVFAKRKLGAVDQVVIKVFSLKDGSSLPQIVRESRALDAARSLGLVLEHQMAPERFFYVMRYVPGESLSVVTQRLHALSSIEGLGDDHLHSVMNYGEDLLVALDTYHNAELWHKDVKPDNIIIDGHDKDAKAHLVDFGLVTPMRSAMTLTTHGTEYFRDPELVRQALRGVKVHQIDGSKFDVYGAGAVMFSMIENSFPAHGGLSQLTKRCPEALRWIVRRSMAEYDRRYPSAAAMLADLRVVMAADDPFKIKPIDLPSVSQGDVAAANQVESERYESFDEPVSFGGSAGSPVPPRVGAPMNPGSDAARVGRPRARLTSWWSGRYSVGGVMPKAGDRPTPRGMSSLHKAKANVQEHVGRVGRVQRPLRDADDRKPAAQQVKDARKRAHTRRTSASNRIRSTRRGRSSYNNTPGVAVVFAGILGLMVLGAGTVLGLAMFTAAFHRPQPPVAPMPPVPMVAGSSVHGAGELQAEVDGQVIEVSTLVGSSGDGLDGVRPVNAQVLVVPMLAQPIDPELLSEIETGLASLREMGMELIGDLSSSDDRAIELTAELANAIGSVPVDSPAFTVKIQQWLSTKGFDGVLVLGTEPGSEQANTAMLVMDEFVTAVPISGRTVYFLLERLNANGYARD